MMNFPLSRRFSYEKCPGRSRGARITEKRFSLSLNQPRFHQKRPKGGKQGIEQNCLEGQTDQVFDGAAAGGDVPRLAAENSHPECAQDHILDIGQQFRPKDSTKRNFRLVEKQRVYKNTQHGGQGIAGKERIAAATGDEKAQQILRHGKHNAQYRSADPCAHRPGQEAPGDFGTAPQGHRRNGGQRHAQSDAQRRKGQLPDVFQLIGGCAPIADGKGMGIHKKFLLLWAVTPHRGGRAGTARRFRYAAAGCEAHTAEISFRPADNSPFLRHCGLLADTRASTLPLFGSILLCLSQKCKAISFPAWIFPEIFPKRRKIQRKAEHPIGCSAFLWHPGLESNQRPNA